VTDARAYYALGLALFRSRRYDHLSHLDEWMGAEGLVNDDWTVLMAEVARTEQQFDQALHIVRSLSRQPPALVTEALTLHAQGTGAGLIEPLLAAATSEEFQDRIFKHPEGNPVAVAHAVFAFLALDRDDHAAAEASARRAIEEDSCCPMAWAVLARAVQLQGRTAEALEAALRGLDCCPGDIDLVQWAVERYLDGGQFKQAAALLDVHREAIASHGQEELTFWLGESIARRQMKARKGPQPAAREALTWPWLNQLQPDSRSWLEDAQNGSQAVPWLRLGIAIYLCKVAEFELVVRLIDPFVAAHRRAGGSGSDLRDLRDYLAGGRPPGIGGTFHALREAARSGGHHDSPLLRTWRQFVRSREWPGAAHLRSTSFLTTLEKLADIRKRVAHLGDLSEAELVAFRNFLLAGEQPGVFFQALGVKP
jgi:hypothetical protein